MRNLVEPLPSIHCELCGGELLLKRVEPVNPPLEIDAQVYICAKCGHEQSRTVTHDPYTAHVPRGGPVSR
jgi:DNA-directed RNA polymerase subunit RPC12/RpoP